jgi:hypothetical protein
MIELAGRVLPRDDRSQLHDLVLVEVPAESLEQLVGDLFACAGDRVGVSESRPLVLVKSGVVA